MALPISSQRERSPTSRRSLEVVEHLLERNMSKLHLLASSFAFVLFFAFALSSCSGVSVDDARKAEAEGRFSDAYQLYSTIVSTAAESFTLPQPKEFKSMKDLEEWIRDSVSAYTKYILTRARRDDLRESFDKLQSLEPHLKYLENKLLLERSEKITVEDYVAFFKAQFFPDQKEIPPKIRNDATDAHNKNLSIVEIEGDVSSYVAGSLYNVEHNIGGKYSISHELGAGITALLPPGKWVSVSRIVPEKSDQRGNYYREVRGIRGRYAATFFSVPDESHIMMFKFRHRCQSPYEC
jgi:hypothetical protein